MPNETRQEPEKTKERKVNPATASLPLLLKTLGTDPERGLTHKEAARRQAASRGTLFADGTKNLKQCIRLVCGEPALWLFLVISLVAVFFGRAAIGLVCTGITLLYAVVCTLMLYYTEQTDARLARYDKPLSRVIRGGRVRRISADAVVKGDVCILHKGDVVPADARLLSATPDFSVTEKELEAKENLRHTVRLAKDPEAHADPNMTYLHSPDNMVFAGGIVCEGSARVVAVGVGAGTHLSGLCGCVKPSHRRQNERSVSAASKVIRTCNLIYILLVIPLTVVGILTLRSRCDLLDIVLSVTALSVLTLRTPMLIREDHVSAGLRAAAASGRDADNTVDIRTSVVLDRLNAIDEVVLVGTAGLHDGDCHPDELCVGGRTYDCTKFCSDALPVRCIEGMYCIRRALMQCGEPLDLTETLHAEEGAALIDELLSWAQPDEEAFRLRVGGVSIFRSGGTDRTLTSVTADMTGGGTVTYRLSEVPSEAASCAMMPDGVGTSPMSMDVLNHVLTESRRAQLSGFRCLYLISTRDGDDCLEGLLIHTPHTCRKTAGIVRSLEESGIRVTAFLGDVTEQNARILSECGLTAQAMADRPAAEETRRPASALCEEGVRAFEGCTSDYVKQYIEDRHKAGKRVCLLTGDADARGLMRLADVSATVSPSLYHPEASGDVPFMTDLYADADGEPDSDCANDLCRRQADMVVRRATANGGGIHGIRKALTTASHYRHLVHSLRRFTVCTQVMRTLTLLIPLCCGLELTSVVLLLLSGMVVDTAAALIAVKGRLPSDKDLEKHDRACPASRPQTADWRGFPRPFLREVIASVISCVVPWAIAGAAVLLGVRFGGKLGSYAVLCLFAAEAAACVTDPCLRGSSRYGFPLSVVMFCVYIAGLAVALGSGLAPWWSLVFPLSGFAAFCIVTALSGKHKHISKKQDTK